MKNLILEAIDGIRGELVELSMEIHRNPELAFKEYKACAALAEFLRKHGFTVETGIAGLETAFRAVRDFGEGPTVAFIAEYDALPEIGHACGHNLIAMMAAGAAAGLAAAGDGFKGKVTVLGTPAEEGLGGKLNMLDGGAFDDVDFALMVHPSGENLINRTSTALQHWTVAFAGKNAHSSNPQNGINALTAAMQTFHNIDVLRPLMPLTANINGIITEGGTAANIITDRAVAEFTVRAKTLDDLHIVCDYITRAVKAAEVLTGASATVCRDACYAEFHPNRAMNRAFGDNMSGLGIVMNEADNEGKYGSSDIGNVSLKVPSVHAYLEIGSNYPGHHLGFTEASASDYAHIMAVKAAKGLALTGFDIMADEALRKRIRDEFEKEVLYPTT
ncbi:MAG: amidohydrolase [Defluviitaleaceae bacterium]|nr:amidohydrolase [Defluviitaleaceae bacterium]MCL2835148.1 amidohydrolase [Defluviitaleaceae bacterium]